ELSHRKATGESPADWLLPPRAALPGLPARTLTPEEERALYQGKPLPAREDGLCWLTDGDGAAFALGKTERGTLKLHINLRD
ncbi:MAG: hypothetical protein FWG93_07685, partial [Oscillospiraceae bacterium]|nr:hypothetical protein [Oscillospiraceae bacterium]